MMAFSLGELGLSIEVQMYSEPQYTAAAIDNQLLPRLN